MPRRLPWLALLLLLCASSAQSDPPTVPVRAGDILSTTLHTATADLHALIRVDPMTGNRSIVSDDLTGTGPVFAEPSDPSVNPNGHQLAFAHGVVVDARGDILVVDEGRWLIWRIDAISGDREILSGCVDFQANLDCVETVGSGPWLPGAWGIALEQDGQILVVDSSIDAVVRIDPTTGDRTVVSGCSFPNCDWSVDAIGTGNNFRIPYHVAVEPDGNILVGDPTAGPPGNVIARVDPVTGDRTPVVCDRCPDGGSGPYGAPQGIAVETDGNILGVSQSLSAIIGVFRVDPITLVRTIVSNADEGTGVPFIYPREITIEETGAILVPDSGRLIRVDPVTGNRELVTGDGVGSGPDFSSFGLAVYPERCGDVNDDGLLDATDVTMLRGYIADPTGAPLPPGGQDKCTVIGDPGPCDVLDQVVISRRLAMLEPGIEPVCVAIAGS